MAFQPNPEHLGQVVHLLQQAASPKPEIVQLVWQQFEEYSKRADFNCYLACIVSDLSLPENDLALEACDLWPVIVADVHDMPVFQQKVNELLQVLFVGMVYSDLEKSALVGPDDDVATADKEQNVKPQWGGLSVYPIGFNNEIPPPLKDPNPLLRGITCWTLGRLARVSQTVAHKDHIMNCLLATFADRSKHVVGAVCQALCSVLEDYNEMKQGAWTAEQLLHIVEGVNASLDPECTSVCNNSAWALGEIAIKSGTEFANLPPGQGAVPERFVKLLSEILKMYIKPFCLNVRNLTDPAEKEHALLGLARIVRNNPNGCFNAFAYICDCISTSDLSPTLKQEFSTILGVFKSHMGDGWDQLALETEDRGHLKGGGTKKMDLASLEDRLFACSEQETLLEQAKCIATLIRKPMAAIDTSGVVEPHSEIDFVEAIFLRNGSLGQANKPFMQLGGRELKSTLALVTRFQAKGVSGKVLSIDDIKGSGSDIFWKFLAAVGDGEQEDVVFVVNNLISAISDRCGTLPQKASGVYDTANQALSFLTLKPWSSTSSRDRLQQPEVECNSDCSAGKQADATAKSPAGYGPATREPDNIAITDFIVILLDMLA
eukprot:gene23359-35777_t